jgi:hypothetical protein
MSRFLGTFSILLCGCAAVRPIRDGAVYRATPLATAQLESSIRNHSIQTVVNLNGFEPNRGWYRRQMEICRRHGAELVDLTINPYGPDRHEIIELLDAFRTRRQPILVVQRPPAAELGFAAALYRLAVLEEPKGQARRELAWWQNHRLPVARLSTLDQFLFEWRGEPEFYATYQVNARRGGTSGFANSVWPARPITEFPVYSSAAKPSTDAPKPAHLGQPESIPSIVR